jgi:hypothetical protein
MRRALKTLVLVCGLAAVGSAFYAMRPSSPARRSTDFAADDAARNQLERMEPPAASQDPPPVTQRVAASGPDAGNERAPRLPDENAIMTKLRLLGDDSPLESLALARHGNEYFPDGGSAPERHWIIARALVNLRRFHEARDEAKLMIERYPDDPRALDVKRHLLVHPLDQPSREEQQRKEP